MKLETTLKLTKLSTAIAASLLLSTLANAAILGPYAGIGLGSSNTNPTTRFSIDSDNWSEVSGYSAKPKLAGKLFAGYNFNQYVGLEAGYAIYGNTKDTYAAHNTTASATYRMNAASLVGKAYLPIQAFNLYALGGAAEVYSKVQNRNNNVSLLTINNNLSLQNGSKTTRALRPVYGIGASYDVNSQVTTGLEFSRIQGKGNTKTNSTAIPSANLLTLTAAYNFG